MARAGFARAALSALILVSALVAMPARAVIVPTPQPDWHQLTPVQKQVLAPLAQDWNGMEGYRRKKWLGIVERFGSMSPAEQTRLQERMSEWSRMGADERKAARENFKALQNAPTDQKALIKQKWIEYQELPENEKSRLKTEAAGRANPPPAAPGRIPLTLSPPR